MVEITTCALLICLSFFGGTFFFILLEIIEEWKDNKVNNFKELIRTFVKDEVEEQLKRRKK